MPDDIKQNATAIADDKDVAAARRFGKFLKRAKSGSFQKRHQINRSLDGGETVIGDNENVGALAQLSFFERAENFSEAIVGALDCRDGFRRSGRGLVLHVIRIAQPDQ